MDLDQNTLFWVLSLSYITSLIFSVALYFLRQTFPGAKLWLAAQASMTLGTLILAFRDSDFPYFLIVTSNTLMMLGLVFYAHAASIFKRPKSFSVYSYLAIPSVALGYILLEQAGISLRSIFFSSTTAIVCFAIFFIFVYKTKRRYQLAAWITGVPFLLSALGNLLRLPELIASPELNNFANYGAVNSIVFLFSIVTSSVSLFGYYTLAGVRFEEIIIEKELRLRKKNQTLLSVNRTKNLFVSMLAHDLRAPIAGASRYLKKHLLPDHVDIISKKQSIEILSASLERTHSLLENLLWWGRSQNRDWPLKPEVFAIADSIRSVIELYELECKAKNITIVTDDLAGKAKADQQTIELIVRNLISNAIKFSKQGQNVHITAEEKRNKLIIKIRDYGEGISEEIMANLFRIEKRIATLGTQGERGSGFGLILSKEFALRNKGTLQIESFPDNGTCATLSIPSA